MEVPTWHSSLRWLRSLHGVPAAQANAITLARAEARWHRALVARTSVHDLLFTLPGDDGHPFSRAVRVQTADGRHLVQRWEGEVLAEERTTGDDDVDRELDAVLERLTAPVLTCRSCGVPVRVAADQFETFEQRHWTCFHHEFEHPPFDPDEECPGGGCPSANVEPSVLREGLRDELVEEIMDSLVVGELATSAGRVQIKRRGPGHVEATFDGRTFQITVRSRPTDDGEHRRS